MTEKRTTPLRERMIEDMRIKGLGEKSIKAYIRAVKDFAAFLGRSPDTATPDDLRAYQLHMSDTGVTPTTYNARIIALIPAGRCYDRCAQSRIPIVLIRQGLSMSLFHASQQWARISS